MSEKIKLGRMAAKNKIHLIGRALGIRDDPFFRDSQVTLKGDRTAVVDGCYGILEYSDCIVKLNIGRKILCFTGADFNILDFADNSITVSGVIKTIEFI